MCQPSTPDPFSADSQRLDTSDIPTVKVETDSIRKKRDRGVLVVPERAFCQLVPLPGKSTLPVYMVLRLKVFLQKSKTVSLTGSFLRRFGLTKDDKRRALQHLEDAGLICVERQHGKNPKVTLLEVNR
jgi:hypothetical protein